MPPGKKQVSLLSAFNRTWEVIEEPKAKPVGRPPKVKVEVKMDDVEDALKEEVKDEEKEKPGPELREDASKFETPTKKAKIEKLGSWEKPVRSPEESPEDYSKRCGKAAGQLGKEFGKLGGRKPQERQRGVSTGLTIRTRQLNY